MRSRCYLIAFIDGATFTVNHVGTYSEPPWAMTRMFGAGAPVGAVLMEAPGDSYQEALDLIHEMYPRHEPGLAARFPLEQPNTTPRTIEVKS